MPAEETTTADQASAAKKRKDDLLSSLIRHAELSSMDLGPIPSSIEVPGPDDPAAVEVFKLRVTAYYELKKIERTRSWESTHLAALEAGYLELLKGSLDRSVGRAQLVAAAASGIGTVYAALLGVGLAIGSSREALGLDWFAAVPGVLVAMAFVLSSASVSMVRFSAAQVDRWHPFVVRRDGLDLVDLMAADLRAFARTAGAAADKGGAARSLSVLVLGIGVAVMPTVWLVQSHRAKIAILVLIGLGVVLSVVASKNGSSKTDLASAQSLDPRELLRNQLQIQTALLSTTNLGKL